jgi:diadenylate cyclase
VARLRPALIVYDAMGDGGRGVSGLFDKHLRGRVVPRRCHPCFDIFIVYYVIYRVLLTIKGTRAAQMVIGIVLIGASFFVAERLEMTTVSWLLDNFINYFIIIVIVVFQQDIRRGLMRIGQNVSRSARPTRSPTPSTRSSTRPTTWPRPASAASWCSSARPISPTSSITAGHRRPGVQGAAGGAVRALARQRAARRRGHHRQAAAHQQAGAVLPLSRSLDLAHEIGTRHRAALGITEETDAVALAISEERGEVSLCFKGNIARDLEAETLRTALQNLFYGRRTPASCRGGAGRGGHLQGGGGDGERRRAERVAAEERAARAASTPRGPPGGRPAAGGGGATNERDRADRAARRRSPGRRRRAGVVARVTCATGCATPSSRTLALKFVALVLSITLFILVNTDKDITINVSVGVSYVMPEDRVLVSRPVDEVAGRGPGAAAAHASASTSASSSASTST